MCALLLRPMTSLKSLIPRLAKSVGMTPAALYERQRALVRAGLLHARPGRGPGSGVPADAQSVAMLLISVAATGSLSEVEDQTKTIANLKSMGGRCPVTGKRTFGAALTAALKSEELLRRALYFTAKRSGKGAMASITFMKKPIDDPAVRFDDLKEAADQSAFGLAPYDFYLKDFAHLTVEATINLWGTLRGVELEASK